MQQHKTYLFSAYLDTIFRQTVYTHDDYAIYLGVRGVRLAHRLGTSCVCNMNNIKRLNLYEPRLWFFPGGEQDIIMLNYPFPGNMI